MFFGVGWDSVNALRVMSLMALGQAPFFRQGTWDVQPRILLAVAFDATWFHAAGPNRIATVGDVRQHLSVDWLALPRSSYTRWSCRNRRLGVLGDG
jgi:hypothetical protein